MRWLSVMRLARLVRSNVDRQLSPSGRSGRDGEAGAVAMIVAMLFGFGVLLGLGALVIDTGSLLYERRQLQNGADAAAFAVGKDCAGIATCTPIATATPFAATPTLTKLAGDNASSDGLTTIESICGNSFARASNPNLMLTDACPPSAGQLVECPPVPSEFASAPFISAPFIEVRTATKTGNTSSPSILPPILAQTLVGGGGGYLGETVRACARVAWLPAGEPTGPVLPVTFTSCQWADATGFKPGLLPPDGNGVAAHYELPPTPGVYPGYGTSGEVTAYALAHPPPAPQLSLWPTKEPDVLFTQTSNGTKVEAPCTTWNQHVAPGTFGELSNIGCTANVVDNWVRGANGNPAPCDLASLNLLRGHIVNVPIFDCYAENPLTTPSTDWVGTEICNYTNPAGSYHISGYAAFYLTGFNFSGLNQGEGNSIWPADNGGNPCSGNDRCISGWFTTGSLSAKPGVFETPFFGTYELQLAG